MPREFSRTRRVETQLQRELSELIHNEMKDPRVAMTTIMDVEVSRNLQQAKIFVTTLKGVEHSECVAVLNSAAGYLRSQLGQRLRMRSTPNLRFIYDTTIESSMKLDAIIDQAVAEDEARHEPDVDS